MKLSGPADLKTLSFTTCYLTFFATDRNWKLNYPQKNWASNSASILLQITNLLQLVLTWISQRKQNDKWRHEKYWRHRRFLSFCLMRRGQNERYLNNDTNKFFSGQVQNTYFNSNKKERQKQVTLSWKRSRQNHAVTNTTFVLFRNFIPLQQKVCLSQHIMH